MPSYRYSKKRLNHHRRIQTAIHLTLLSILIFFTAALILYMYITFSGIYSFGAAFLYDEHRLPSAFLLVALILFLLSVIAWCIIRFGLKSVELTASSFRFHHFFRFLSYELPLKRIHRIVFIAGKAPVIVAEATDDEFFYLDPFPLQEIEKTAAAFQLPLIKKQ